MTATDWRAFSWTDRAQPIRRRLCILAAHAQADANMYRGLLVELTADPKPRGLSARASRAALTESYKRDMTYATGQARAFTEAAAIAAGAALCDIGSALYHGPEDGPPPSAAAIFERLLAATALDIGPELADSAHAPR